MDDISLYYLVMGAFGVLIALVVTIFAIRTARNARPSRPGFDPESPDPELLDEVAQDDDPSIEGPSDAAEHLRQPNPPRVGVEALREADPSYSEPEAAVEVAALFSAAWMARASGELGALSRRLSEGAAETLLAGRADMGALREVLVDAPRLTDAGVEEPWARATWEIQAILHGIWEGEVRDMLTHERWALARHLEGGGGWTLRQILDRELAPLTHPPFDRGHTVEHGGSLATLLAPDLEERRQDLLARHPQLDLEGLLGWVGEFFVYVQDALDRADPGLLGELCTSDRRSALEFAVARLSRTGLRRRIADVKVESVELARIGRDGRYDLVTARVHAHCRQWLEDDAGQLRAGVPEDLRRFSEYWTVIRPLSGEAPSAIGRQGFKLWRIETDENYNG